MVALFNILRARVRSRVRKYSKEGGSELAIFDGGVALVAVVATAGATLPWLILISGPGDAQNHDGHSQADEGIEDRDLYGDRDGARDHIHMPG
jgi:hypothetical protein